MCIRDSLYNLISKHLDSNEEKFDNKLDKLSSDFDNRFDINESNFYEIRNKIKQVHKNVEKPMKYLKLTLTN